MSATIVLTKMLVKTDVKENNNKFWEGTLFGNEDVLCRWGRVGADGQEKTFPGAGQKFLDSKVREKEKKGYKEVQGINTPKGATAVVSGSQLKEVAKKQIKSSGCKVTTQLIEYLVQVNRHDIKTASGGKLTVSEDGLIKTDVGVVVTQDTLNRARNYLVSLSTCLQKNDWDSEEFVTSINEYLMAVPQKVGSKRGWEKLFLKTPDDIQRQGSLIDSMEATLKACAAAPISDNQQDEEKVFNVELSLLDDKPEIDRVTKFYKSTLQRQHACSHLQVRNVYKVKIEVMSEAFEKHGAKLDPVLELWHGTRASNLLSILKGGLIIPPSNAAHVTGRMFGDGIYLSDQSTKSLNYAYGYWGGGPRDNHCYMFLCKAGMGKFHTPPGPIRTWPKGYDSIFAKANQSGVGNNEMIVPTTNQLNLTHLVEFAP